MVDRDKIHQKVRIIEGNCDKLRQLSQMPFEEFSGDFRNIETSKHLLQVAIEAMIDIGTHVIAHKKLRNPESNADVFNVLKEAGIIEDGAAANYQLMAKFRNRVVHFYQEIGNQEIYSIIANKLDDFRRFIASIMKLL